jgi:rod shape-determining protein MreD
MITDLIRYIVSFFALLVIQVALFNNIHLGGFINPFIYVMFILILPVRISGPLLLVLAFLLGIIIDMFSNTIGMHAAACVLMAFARPTVLKFIAPREGYETEAAPSIKQFGVNWFVIYCTILVFLHHLSLFFIEVFRLSEFLPTLLRVILSTMSTSIFIVMVQFLTDKPQQKK